MSTRNLRYMQKFTTEFDNPTFDILLCKDKKK